MPVRRMGTASEYDRSAPFMKRELARHRRQNLGGARPTIWPFGHREPVLSVPSRATCVATGFQCTYRQHDAAKNQRVIRLDIGRFPPYLAILSAIRVDVKLNAPPPGVVVQG